VRDREKDKEKRKVHSDEETQRRIKLKQAQDEGGFTDPDDEESDVAGVRNFIPQRRRSGGGRRRDMPRVKESANPMKASKRVVRIDDSITVGSLAQEMSVKVSVVIKSLMSLGVLANATQQLDTDTAVLVAQEFGFEVQNTARSIGDILSSESHSTEQEENFEQFTRAPVVTIMGHVDHGKTSLLDALRESKQTESEAGGITQHIGAYRVNRDGRPITFIDTPGHAAFTEMRARGAKVTDIVILVVAADDGVMPQTVEAINHAKSAAVPVVVAVNKMDKPSANYDRILGELASHGITAEEWGGDSIFVKVSALTKMGLGDLLDSVLLQAEVLDLRARTEGAADGVVIESRLDKARGPVATFLINKGTLRKGDNIVAGKSAGRVRAMFDDTGEKLEIALPGVPVEVLGLDAVPSAGDGFNVVANDSVAKQAVQYRIDKDRKERAAAFAKTNIQDLLAQLATSKSGQKELPLIIKADTHGSVEAIRGSLEKLGTDQVICKVIHSAVGGLTETDVTLASAAHALVIGFNVRPDRKASEAAENLGVNIKSFSIIYELIDAVELAMAGKLEPIRHERIQGHAEVRNLFSVPKIGVIAGCAVTDGKINRNAQIRVVRDGIVLFTGRVGSLKRFKEDAREVASGYECGIGVDNYNDLRVGDVLECFLIEEVAATLRPQPGAGSNNAAGAAPAGGN
jgi:translation initiation factor IF-2